MNLNFNMFWKPLDDNLLRYAMQYGQTPTDLLKWELNNAWSVYLGEIKDILLMLLKNNLNVFSLTAPVEQHDTSNRKDT